MSSKQYIEYDDINYGAHIIDYDNMNAYSENVKYHGAEFNKLYLQKVRLPEGRGNIIYLLSNNLENSLKMIKSQYFYVPTTYRKIFYPQLVIGQMMGRRIKYSISGPEKKTRNALISKETSMRPIITRTISNKSTDNLFFITSDIYTSSLPVISKYSPRRIYEEFYSDLLAIIKPFSPEPTVATNSTMLNDRRIIIIDAEGFKFNSSDGLNISKTNPLYMIYLAFLQNRSLKILGIDIDFMLCYKNTFIKFNPATTTKDDWSVFKRALFKIMNINLDEYTDKLPKSDQSELSTSVNDKAVSTIVKDSVGVYSGLASTTTTEVLASAVENKVKKNLQAKGKMAEEISKSQDSMSVALGSDESDNIFTKNLKAAKFIGSDMVTYKPLLMDTGETIEDDEESDEFDKIELYNEDDIKDEVNDVLTDDEEIAAEVLNEIQEKKVPMKNLKTAPVNSARDQKLREQQKKLIVKNETIEQIIERDASIVQIETADKSAVMHTSNENMKKIKFANFEKTYIDKLYTKHLLACFDMLKDLDTPFYIIGVDIKDTSNTMNYQETWTIKLEDEVKKKHTIKVDIPKFINDRFMLINGTKWIILKQNFYNPLVKDTPDTVILTSNYNKVTIDRKATKSLGQIEKIFTVIKKTGDNKMFVSGDASAGNLKYISSLEYDELSRRLFQFNSKSCKIYFSRDYIKDSLSDKIPKNLKDDEFYIGDENGSPIIINDQTGLDKNGRTIINIIESNLPEDYQMIFNSVKAPTQSMYAEGKLAGQMIPIIVTLMVWHGLKGSLDRIGVKWTFHQNVKRIKEAAPGFNHIRFGDGILEYEAKTYAELILNGLAKIKPETLTFEDCESEISYKDYIYSRWGTYAGIVELRNFKEFLIDPITKTTCRDLLLPEDPAGLLIHAVKLLADNAYVSKASDRSYRTRSIEMIPSILYSAIAAQYKTHVKSGRRVPLTLNQRVVISKLIAEKTVEAYSTLNPVIEVSKTHTISTKGYRGSNSDHSYDEEKRSYDPSSVGKLAISTSADANVGINKQLVVEPTISNASGYREQVDDLNELKDVNVFSPVEMLTPGTAKYDDPIRTAIAGKQSQHVVPVADASPALVSNGFDEALQFHLSDDFVINAEEDGTVVDINEELGFVMVKYKSGKTRAIYTKPEIIKNSGGGFYMSNELTPTFTKVGEKFKKDEPLAYQKKYFQYSKTHGLRYSVGPLIKVALMSTYNTYEDAGICTEALADRMKSALVYLENGKFKRNHNILNMVKVGDTVNIGDVLIKFDSGVEDNELAKYLSKLSEDNAALLEEESKSDLKTKHAGKVIDIKVYTLLAPENLSKSLGDVVRKYFDKGLSKKDYLEKFDSSPGNMKSGYFLTDSTEPIENRYNTIKGAKGIDVLIEIYIEHDDVLGVGDKIALYSANKQIVSEVIPKGWEPYSEFDPDEEISCFANAGTISRRMTPACMTVGAAMKCLIYLKRNIKKKIKYK